MNFKGLDGKGVGGGQVPGVPRQLALDLVEESRGPEDLQGLFPVQHDPEEGVKADEVVDMGVGDKGVGNLEKLGRPAVSQLPHIKEQGPPFPENLDEKRRVLERIVDELGLKKRFQGSGFQKKYFLFLRRG